MKRLLPLLLLTLGLSAADARAADWSHWRGPEQNGVSREKDLPDSWSPDPKAADNNLVWSAAYGGINVCARPCIAALHTHDDSGVMHIESKQPRTYTLGEFFTEWNVPLNAPSAKKSVSKLLRKVARKKSSRVGLQACMQWRSVSPTARRRPPPPTTK